MTTGQSVLMGRIRWRRTAIRAALAAIPLLFLLPIALGLGSSRTLERWENALYDVRVRLISTERVDPRVVILDIDQKSLGVEGRWPWSRAKLAALLDQLFDHYGARVVALDVLFADRDEAATLELIDDLKPLVEHDPTLKSHLDEVAARHQPDRRFAAAMIARNVVLGFAFKPHLFQGEPPTRGAAPRPVQMTGAPVKGVPWIEPKGFLGILPELQSNAAAVGFIDAPLVDRDGVIRRTPLLQQFDGQLYESLALATARIALGQPRVELGFAQEDGTTQRLEQIKLGDAHIPVDAQGALLIPLRGPLRSGANSFPHVSASEVLRGETSPSVLKDAIVLLGEPLQAQGTRERRFLGPEAHANIIMGILDQAVLAKPSWSRTFEVLVLVACLLIAALFLPAQTLASQIISTAACAAVLVAFNLWAWSGAGLVLPLASPILGLTLCAALVISYGYFIEGRRRRRLSSVFSRYVSPEVVHELDATNAEVSLEGESREMSVLFSDVRGFTTLSEGFSPRELTRIMNELLTPLTEVIQNRRGTIDKYMGDSIMAFWGAPLPDPDHARRSVEAALHMIDCTRRLAVDFAKRGWPEVNVGIGISSGLMNVGNMGSRYRMAYTVLGDTVNLGSRLESLTKQYGVGIIVSGATAKLCPDMAFRELDLVKVKGRTEPVAIYEPLGPIAQLPAAHMTRLEAFSEMLRLYRGRHFSRAQELLGLLAAEREEPLIALYRQRVAHFLAEPPPGTWDGVFIHQTK
jgi:adenylate cyclase